MAFKRHSFPEICKTGKRPNPDGNIGHTFRPLFTHCHQQPSVGGPPESEASLTNQKEQARKQGMLKGRQAAVFDANCQCAGEMISLLECLLTASRNYTQKKKELVEAAGHWIVDLADHICQKVIGCRLDDDKQQLAQFLGNWIEAGLYQHLPAEITAGDTLQFLFSAAEMMMPCEQETAKQMQCKLDQLRNLPESFLDQVEKKPPVVLGEQLAAILKNDPAS